jgi:heterodisulfide reductase subunit C
MDLTPRRVMALVREGFREDALRSQTIWLCASCYACSVDCPQQISITDIMYALKREAIQSHLYPRRFPVPVLAREFYEMVRRRGRNSEFWLVLRMALRSNPLILFPMLKTVWRLWRTGRLTMRLKRIDQTQHLRHASGLLKEVK